MKKLTKKDDKLRTRLRNGDVTDRLHLAVLEFVEAHGGSVIVAGGIEVQDWVDGAHKYRLAVRCVGRAPSMSTTSDLAKPTPVAAAENPKKCPPS